MWNYLQCWSETEQIYPQAEIDNSSCQLILCLSESGWSRRLLWCWHQCTVLMPISGSFCECQHYTNLLIHSTLSAVLPPGATSKSCHWRPDSHAVASQSSFRLLIAAMKVPAMWQLLFGALNDFLFNNCHSITRQLTSSSKERQNSGEMSETLPFNTGMAR